MTEYEKGQWEFSEKFLAWLNTLDESRVSKSDLYKWAMEYRPSKK